MNYNNHTEIWKSIHAFDLHKRQNLIYPELDNPAKRFFCVPLEFEIDQEDRPFNIIYTYNKSLLSKTDWPKVVFEITDATPYLDAAIRIVLSYDGWKTYKMDGHHISHKTTIGIHFCYHKDIFDHSHSIILNPDVRPMIENNTITYQSLIEGKFGCDGLAHLLCIVEKDGNLSTFECLGNSGKTNCEIAENYILKLGKWQPAVFQGNNVRSQMELLVYVN